MKCFEIIILSQLQQKSNRETMTSKCLELFFHELNVYDLWVLENIEIYLALRNLKILSIAPN